MILPDPSIALEPGNKVVVFVHQLREGLTAGNSPNTRTWTTPHSPKPNPWTATSRHEFASSEDGTVFMSYWRDDESVSEWAKTRCIGAPKHKGRRNGTPPTAPSFARSSGTVCQNPEFRTYPIWFVGNSRLSFTSR